MTIPDSFRLLAVGGALACLTLAAGPVGCESESEPAQTYVPPPPPPPKPQGPVVTPISELVAKMGIDERVNLPEEKAPKTDVQRRAVLAFFDAFARGDSTAVGSMLSRLDQRELEALVQSGAWDETTSKIELIDVDTAEHEGQTVAFGMFHVGFDYQPQLWYYTADEDGATFDAVAAPPNIVERLSSADWITAWFDLLAEELALADKPDEEFAVPQKNYSTGTGGGSGPAARRGPSNPFNPGPGGPGGPGKRPKPKGPKRKPPGPPS
jgi:hypothetical protein